MIERSHFGSYYDVENLALLIPHPAISHHYDTPTHSFSSIAGVLILRIGLKALNVMIKSASVDLAS